MIKEYIATGKTVDDAIQSAKLGLNAPIDAFVKTEVLEMPKKGFLGIGSKPAKVKASYDDGVSEKKPTQKKQAPKKQNNDRKPVKKEAPKKEAPKKEAKKPAPKKEAIVNEEQNKENDFPKSVDLEYAKSYLAEIVKGLNVDNAEITAEYCEGVITMNLDCEEYGIIIGRRGETLDSIQYLLTLAMKKKTDAHIRVSINIGNYREKRNETLKHLAKKNASYVLKTGRRYTFEPMNPYERRVIHTTVQGIDGVESRSIGYNQDRRVVLEPTGGVKPRSNRRPALRPAPAPADREKKVDRADIPKFGKIEVNK